ncbi:MAG: hypothetical protein Q4C47_06560 [Planctomycetia bacterium]|nr:hypothetical protein [Planctomycetia bacterium]
MGIVLTEEAAAEVRQVLDIQRDISTKERADAGEPAVENEEFFVRVSIAGGGCSGIRYRLNLDTGLDPERDVRYESCGIGLVTTKKYAPYLDGTRIELGGEPGDEHRGFLVQNPHYANMGCPGCGGH